MFELTYKIIITTLSIIRTNETAYQKTNLQVNYIQVNYIIALYHAERVKFCDILSQIQTKVKYLRPNKHIPYHAEYFMGCLSAFHSIQYVQM